MRHEAFIKSIALAMGKYDICSLFNRDNRYIDMKIGQGVMKHLRYQRLSNLDSKV